MIIALWIEKSGNGHRGSGLIHSIEILLVWTLPNAVVNMKFYICIYRWTLDSVQLNIFYEQFFCTVVIKSIRTRKNILFFRVWSRILLWNLCSLFFIDFLVYLVTFHIWPEITKNWKRQKSSKICMEKSRFYGSFQP